MIRVCACQSNAPISGLDTPLLGFLDRDGSSTLASGAEQREGLIRSKPPGGGYRELLLRLPANGLNGTRDAYGPGSYRVDVAM